MVTFEGKEYANWAEARASTRKPEPVPVAPVALLDPEPVQVSIPTQDQPRRRQSLTERYRPRRLADVVGQPEIVAHLQALAADPYPCAIILAGETGTGKTSSAWALAADLGCNIDADPVEFGGVFSIASGEHNADTLRELWPTLWRIPFESEHGWKVVIVNECEAVNSTVERLWLDRLEELPPKTVIVFTTNNLASLPARFVDRCIGGVLEFRAAADDLAEHGRALARSIWRTETGAEMPADVLDRVVTRSIQAGRMSFRRVVQNIVAPLAQKASK